MKAKTNNKEKANNPTDTIIKNTKCENKNTFNHSVKEANSKTERLSNKNSTRGNNKSITNGMKNDDKLEHLNANQLIKAKSNHSEIQIADNQLDISQDIMSNTLKNLQDKMLNSSDFHEESKVIINILYIFKRKSII